MIEILKGALIKALEKQGINNPIIHFEHPEDNTFGDYSSNAALVYAKQLKISPKVFANKIVEELNKELQNNTKLSKNNEFSENIKSISVAGPGFINFSFKDKYFLEQIKTLLEQGENVGKNILDRGKKVMVEYTDPNPFKIFHIGHLMANTIGESLSRIVEFSGANVIRACYQGDVGLHVAKTIWATMKDGKSLDEITVKYLGDMYVIGSEKYENDENAKKEIIDINKKIFDKTDDAVNMVYDFGKKISLEYFDQIYKKLGTNFNNFFWESEVAENGLKIVKEFLDKGVFEKSDGAVVFPGEKYGEHTRVFINSQGLPTYETKEIGLTIEKFDLYPDLSLSVVVTANEQNAYFKVILACLKVIYPDIEKKIKHISHGILRPLTGKMSSRKGNIVSAEVLIEEFEKLVKEKMKDRKFEEKEYSEIVKEVAIAGLKYTILRQSIGGDIIYDPEKAVSFDGDSGPYLQYATVRANAVIAKAKEANISEVVEEMPEKVDTLEKILIRFPEVVERARVEYAPHHIVTYLIELASAFNSYYANNQIINIEDKISPYRVSLAKVFSQVMKNGLWVLGIEVPGRM
jgi:arginyl-tRNA synthetase